MQARFAAACALAGLTAVGVLLLPASVGAGPGVRDLRDRDARLAAEAASAAVQLYALEAAAARAQAELGEARARAEALAAERATVRDRLALARRTLRAAESDLGERLRALYVQGDTTPLEILLGAKSVDEAIAGLDGLRFAADQDRMIVERARAARRELAGAEERLAAQARELRALETAAAERADALARRRDARAAYLGRLRSERRVTAAQIAALEREAAAARRKSVALTAAAVGATATPATPPPAAEAPGAPAPPAGPREPEQHADGGSTLTVSATGYAIRGRTATGLPTGWGVAAVDPAVIPLGTRFTVPGYGVAVAADVGSAVRGAEIDLWFPSRAQALAWGRRTVTIVLH